MRPWSTSESILDHRRCCRCTRRSMPASTIRDPLQDRKLRRLPLSSLFNRESLCVGDDEKKSRCPLVVSIALVVHCWARKSKRVPGRNGRRVSDRGSSSNTRHAKVRQPRSLRLPPERLSRLLPRRHSGSPPPLPWPALEQLVAGGAVRPCHTAPHSRSNGATP